MVLYCDGMFVWQGHAAGCLFIIHVQYHYHALTRGWVSAEPRAISAGTDALLACQCCSGCGAWRWKYSSMDCNGSSSIPFMLPILFWLAMSLSLGCQGCCEGWACRFAQDWWAGTVACPLRLLDLGHSERGRGKGLHHQTEGFWQARVR